MAITFGGLHTPFRDFGEDEDKMVKEPEGDYAKAIKEIRLRGKWLSKSRPTKELN
tara:strand:+ start:982 stop:1146 length:165 start_codon:yes stop_codon:yes gene_type:complete